MVRMIRISIKAKEKMFRARQVMHRRIATVHSPTVLAPPSSLSYQLLQRASKRTVHIPMMLCNDKRTRSGKYFCETLTPD